MTDIALANFIFYLSLFLKLMIILYTMAFLNKSKYIHGYNKRVSLLLWLILLLLCVYAVSGDYWTYKYWYEEGGDYYDAHMEPIWNYIRKIIPWGFSVFRAVVWGAGLLLIAKIIDYCHVDKALTYCLIGVFYISYFSYARAAVALAFLAFGFVFLYRSKEEVNSNRSRWLLFILFAWIGLLMHRSMYIIIPALLLPLWIKLNRQSITVLIILFPLLSFLFNVFFPYISSYAIESELVGDSASNYLTLEYDKTNRFLKELFDRLPMILFYLMALFKLYKNKDIPDIIKKVSTAAFFILYTGFLFSTITNGNGMTFFYRTLNMAYPFMIITTAYTIHNVNQMKNESLFFVVVALLMLLINIRFYIFINPNYIYEQMMNRYLL